ncbi:serine/threonine protein kinase, partial [Planctomycetota bacterium]|nr:serine/threonine protein kinase [Planctomycetota bacterium]
MLLDAPHMDTPLARMLHARGRLRLDALQHSLTQSRSVRPGGPTLARLLVQRGLLSASEVEQCLDQLNVSRSGIVHSGVLNVSGEAPLPLEDSQDSAESTRLRWLPGSRVGGYVLVEKLGEGGMGVVYLAEHPETGMRYAVKGLSSRADPELLLRFKRESEAQAQVDGHPNVVRIHTAGVSQGRAYYVMDLAEGGDLARRLENGPLPARKAAEVVRDLCHGLAYCHAQGILHRDLKPANVMFDSEGRPKLLDFGLAKLVGAESLTMTGEVIGTPAYMAPE